MSGAVLGADTHILYLMGTCSLATEGVAGRCLLSFMGCLLSAGVCRPLCWAQVEDKEGRRGPCPTGVYRVLGLWWSILIALSSTFFGKVTISLVLQTFCSGFRVCKLQNRNFAKFIGVIEETTYPYYILRSYFHISKKTVMVPIMQIVMLVVVILLVLLADTSDSQNQDFHKSSEIFVTQYWSEKMPQ